MARTRFSFKPESVFLAFGIVYGIVFLLTTPPFQISDEPEHFYRAYQISEGRLVAAKCLVYDKSAGKGEVSGNTSGTPAAGGSGSSQQCRGLKETGGVGGLLPVNLGATTKEFYRLIEHPENKQKVRDLCPLLRLHLNEHDRSFLHFPNTAVFSPVPYLPQAAGIALGRVFGFPPLLLMYLGRFLNLFTWILLVYLSIKTVPFCKWLFFLLSLMPMSLYEAASLSADGFTIGLSFLVVSLFSKAAFDWKVNANLTLLFITSLALALSKQAYFLMPLLFLLIPVEKIGSRQKYFAIFSLLIFAVITAMMLWTWKAGLYRDIYVIYHYLFPQLSAEKQIRFILTHPLDYFRIMGASLAQNARLYMDSFIGYLGWFDTNLPELLRISYMGMLLFAVLGEDAEKMAITLKQRVIIFVTLVLGVGTIITLAYVGWNPVGAHIVRGVQGRYFIPLAPLFFLLFHRRKVFFSLSETERSVSITVFSFFTLSYSVYTIIDRYYV